MHKVYTNTLSLQGRVHHERKRRADVWGCGRSHWDLRAQVKVQMEKIHYPKGAQVFLFLRFRAHFPKKTCALKRVYICNHAVTNCGCSVCSPNCSRMENFIFGGVAAGAAICVVGFRFNLRTSSQPYQDYMKTGGCFIDTAPLKS